MTEVTSTVDIQDPLPESNWLWRRVFTFITTGVILAFLWFTLEDLAAVAVLSPVEGIGALLKISRSLLTFSGLIITYYLIAPSAEQVIKMFKTAALLRSGVQIASRSVEQPGRKEVAQTVGQPPQPEAPVIEETPPQAGTTAKKETEILE